MPKRIIIVGGGPGGYVAAIRAAQLGAEVHLVEMENMGGVCLNIGCIPTKAMLHVAETYQAVLKGKSIGIDVDNAKVNWPAVMKYKQDVVNRLVKGVEGLLKANGVTVHRGHAALRSPSTVDVNGSEIVADAIILATGSEPARPNFPGSDLPGMIDSTAALSLDNIPESMIILGGGVIGVEFASMYADFGCKVTIVEMLPKIIPAVDNEIGELLHAELVRKRITIHTGACLTGVTRKGSQLTAEVEINGQQTEITAEKLLVAVGRRPRTAGIGLENVGVAIKRGSIVVDKNFMSSIPDVYAVGDCSSQTMLAHVASAQGIAAVEHAMGHKPVYFGHIIPACIYVNPEIACVGLTEEQARAKGIPFKTGVFQLSGNGKSIIESNGVGMIKIIAGSKHGEILGVHIWGPRATDLIAEAALAMRLEATIDELITTIHAHPTVSEGMPEAALAVEGIAIHWPPGLKKTK
jgi:dihydrolipoamide dehydrogenase